MASSRTRPPGSLERNGAQSSRPSSQRTASQHLFPSHHTDDELFAARVAALIAERHRLLRKGLIHRLQHLKAALLSTELNHDLKSAEQPRLRLEQDRDGAPENSSPAQLLRPYKDSALSLHPSVSVSIRNRASTALPHADHYSPSQSGENSSAENQGFPKERAARPSLPYDLRTHAEDANRTEQSDKLLSTVASGDHAQCDFPQLPHSYSQQILHSRTLPKCVTGDAASTTSLRSLLLISQPLEGDLQSSTEPISKSIVPSPPLFNASEPAQSKEYPQVFENKPLTRQLHPSASTAVEHGGKDQLSNVSRNALEESGPHEFQNAHFETENRYSSEESYHSLRTISSRRNGSETQYSNNATEESGPVHGVAHPSGQSSAVEVRDLRRDSASPISPLFRSELQLFSKFSADISEPVDSRRWRFRDASAKYRTSAVAPTGSLVSQIERKNTVSVSGTSEDLHGDRPSLDLSLLLKDSLSGLLSRSPGFSRSELAQVINSSKSLPGRDAQTTEFEEIQIPDVLDPSTGVRKHLTLLSTVFFDTEFLSLIDNNFRVPVVLRDSSLQEAARICGQISCTLDRRRRSSAEAGHCLPTAGISPYLPYLYVEPEPRLASSTPGWIAELQEYFATARTPVSANFQRRTYLNMSEHDERRAPAAAWHFDKTNFSPNTDKLTEFSPVSSHVAYGTATSIRGHGSYYSNQGVHSSPGDTSVALNFGFQTRTNYPIRKTYLHTHNPKAVSREEGLTQPAHALFRNEPMSKELLAQTRAAALEGISMGPYDADSLVRDELGSDEDIPVYSIDHEGRVIAGRHQP